MSCSNNVAALLAIASGLMFSQVNAQDSANLGRIMWSGFQCSIFAEIAAKTKEQERLFLVGYDAGIRLLNGVKDKSIPETALKNAPIGVLMRLGGPSTDFMVGRIFEAAAEDAHDVIVKRDAAGGVITDASKWNMDDGLKRSIAQNKYSSGNCELLR